MPLTDSVVCCLQVHRTPSGHPIHLYEAGEDLLRPLPLIAAPSVMAVGPLVDTDELLRETDTLLEAPAIDPTDTDQGRRHGESNFAPPEPDPRPSTHVGPIF